MPRGGEVSLLPRGSWDPFRTLLPGPTSLGDKETFTTAAWKRDDSLLIAGTNKVRRIVFNLTNLVLPTHLKYLLKSWIMISNFVYER